MDNSACQNNVVNITQELIDPNRRTTARIAKVLEIVRIGGDTVIHLDAGGDFFSNLLNHFFMRHHTVRSQRKNDPHIFIGHTQTIHFIDKHRHEVVTVGNTCRVIANKSNRITRLNNFRQSRRANRMIDRIQNTLFNVLHRREIFGTNDLQNVVFFVVKRFRTVTIGKSKLFGSHRKSFRVFLKQLFILTCV